MRRLCEKVVRGRLQELLSELIRVTSVDPLQMTDKDKEKEENWRTGKENYAIFLV